MAIVTNISRVEQIFYGLLSDNRYHLFPGESREVRDGETPVLPFLRVKHPDGGSQDIVEGSPVVEAGKKPAKGK